jgi:hypothetical protein
MTNRRTRNPVAVDDPEDSNLEAKFNRIADHVVQTRHEVARIAEEIHRDVERLRQAAAELPPLPRAAPVEAAVSDLPGRVAALVAAELAGPLLQAAVGRIVDSRFNALTEALKQKLQQGRDPLQGLQLNPSRRRR